MNARTKPTPDTTGTRWEKILNSTPVVMTLVATMLAGLSASEMNHAQYDRSLAAQQQSKAGDQWSFFQAKRLRGAMQINTLDLLQHTTPIHPLDPNALKSLLPGPLNPVALTALRDGTIPQLSPTDAPDVEVQTALSAIENSKPENEIASLIAKLRDEPIDRGLVAARNQVRDFDNALTPINQIMGDLEHQLSTHPGTPANRTLNRDFTAARLRFTASRYDAEAYLNRNVANLYELQVRRSNLSAERHRIRSQRLFFGMLIAQAAVIIATFAIAARKRNLLWSLAATAGVAAISFAAYVYFSV